MNLVALMFAANLPNRGMRRGLRTIQLVIVLIGGNGVTPVLGHPLAGLQ